MVEWCELTTSMGKVFAACTSRGLCRLSFPSELLEELNWLEAHYPREEIRAQVAGGSSLLQQVERELTEYLAGSRTRFTVPLDLSGTAFQKAVWQELLKVSYGQTISYGALAARAGYPRAARAVGGAMRANPVSVLVPCHRVLPADGSVGCYSGGRERKRLLLHLEGAAFKEKDVEGRP